MIKIILIQKLWKKFGIVGNSVEIQDPEYPNDPSKKPQCVAAGKLLEARSTPLIFCRTHLPVVKLVLPLFHFMVREHVRDAAKEAWKLSF